jgi:hypothetical protein
LVIWSSTITAAESHNHFSMWGARRRMDRMKIHQTGLTGFT